MVLLLFTCIEQVKFHFDIQRSIGAKGVSVANGKRGYPAAYTTTDSFNFQQGIIGKTCSRGDV